MRWSIESTMLPTGEHVHGKPGIVKDWHLWFAWHQVKLKDTAEHVWLERVWRKIIRDHPYNGFYGYGSHGWMIKTEYRAERP